MQLVVIVLWILGIWTAIVMAQKKNYHTGIFAMLAVVFGILPAIVLLFLPDRTPEPPLPAMPMLPFPCPACGLKLQPQAEACACGKTINEEERAAGLAKVMPQSRVR